MFDTRGDIGIRAVRGDNCISCERWTWCYKFPVRSRHFLTTQKEFPVFDFHVNDRVAKHESLVNLVSCIEFQLGSKQSRICFEPEHQ